MAIRPKSTKKAGFVDHDVEREIPVRVSDLKVMLEAMECDDTLRWCETCGAWLSLDDPALATAGDYTGCWKMATGRQADASLCRSYRGALIDEIKMLFRDKAPA